MRKISPIAALSRRRFLVAGAALAASPALAQTRLDVTSLGVVPNAPQDQSQVLQAAIYAAAGHGLPLFLPAGTYKVSGITLPEGGTLTGVANASILQGAGNAPILKFTDTSSINVEGLVFDGTGITLGEEEPGLIVVRNGDNIEITGCSFANSNFHAIAIGNAEVAIRDCDITRASGAGIFCLDGRGLMVSGNTVSDCGNGGVLIWRSETGDDGSIITGNRIARIDWTGGGNGQNGNGVNIFRAGGVIVSANHFADCAFTAVRINGGRNSQVIGNTCLRSGEVAIFSEFEFSGSLIANNIVDGAAGGISMTNLREGGALAVCAGNMVRNIAASSEVNPDTTPFGIAAEADAAVTGNVVENCPGVGLVAGYGPYLRNVLIADNVVRKARIGIGVTVADGAGSARIEGNLIAASTEHAIAALRWDEVASGDLMADAAQFANVQMGDNSVVAE